MGLQLPERQHLFLMELSKLIDKGVKPIRQARFMKWFDDELGDYHHFTNSFVSRTFDSLKKRRGMIYWEFRKFGATVKLTYKGKKYVEMHTDVQS